MAFFEWNKELEIGNQIIDYQHKRLVGLINDLYEIQEKEDFKEELIEVIIEELKQYAKFHFKTEEAFFKKTGVANLEAHKLVHRSFEGQLDSFIKEREKYEELDKDLLKFLKSWLVNHIKVEDKAMLEDHVAGVGLI